MAGLIDELINVLNAESSQYESLLDMARQKTPVIVKGDIESLKRFTCEEQSSVEKLMLLEKKRAECVDDIRTVLSLGSRSLNIKDIIDILKGQPQAQKALSEAHDRIKGVLKDFQMVNDMNRSLIEESLEMTDFNINLMKSMYQAPDTANYNSRSGYSNDPAVPVRGLFDKNT